MEKETKKERKKDRKKERKGRGKGKKRQCLTRTIFDAKSYRFRYRFVIVRESCVCVPFFWQSSKRWCSDHQPGTFLVQNLRHYANTERKRPKALNSRRMMDKSRTLDFKSLDTDH